MKVEHVLLTGVIIASVIVVIGGSAPKSKKKYDPCCELPCENNGICYSKGFENYGCDCTRTEHYGKKCETAEFFTSIKKFFKPSKSTIQYLVTHFKYVWYVVNRITWLRKAAMRAVLKIRLAIISEPSPYIANDDYTSWRTSSNDTVYARTLPPIPRNCPTAMGVKGNVELPDAEYIAERLFLRKKFIPCPRRTNLLFPIFAQHFNHQYFKTDAKKGLPFQWGGHTVDLSHIYGHTLEREHALRSHRDGKMKVSTINGETFPPKLEDAEGIDMVGQHRIAKKHQLALGHPGFAPLAPFLIFSTIWIREHNRVCDILRTEHPEWDDERLYQTARLVVTGETIKVIVEDYVQHLSGFHFNLIYDPEIMMDAGLSYHNQIHIEFHQLYHWHALMPDYVKLQQKPYKIEEMLFNPEPLLETGINRILTEFNTQFAGQPSGGHNQGAGTLAVAVRTIEGGRKMRLQPLNKYRQKFGMKPHRTFEELAGNKETAAVLKEMYGDIDAVELFVGMMIEKRRQNQVFGETLTEMGAPYSLRGLFGNPLASPAWWKPVTFGGDVGFDIVKTARLQTLICNNVRGCPTISFAVPHNESYNESQFPPVVTEDKTANILISLVENSSSVNIEGSMATRTCDVSNAKCDLFY